MCKLSAASDALFTVSQMSRGRMKEPGARAAGRTKSARAPFSVRTHPAGARPLEPLRLSSTHVCPEHSFKVTNTRCDCSTQQTLECTEGEVEACRDAATSGPSPPPASPASPPATGRSPLPGRAARALEGAAAGTARRTLPHSESPRDLPEFMAGGMNSRSAGCGSAGDNPCRSRG